MPSPHSRKVLVVHPDSIHAELIAELAESMGCFAEIYASPSAALERLLSGEKTCMIAVQNELPGVSGGRFLEAVRRQGIHTPALLFATYWNRHLSEAEIVAKLNDVKVLCKPVGFEQIIEPLEQHLQQDCCP